ncbi:hypothetical protein [Pseudobacillus badius]|uniref:hypothetical protein n=1 Tax=Bacillus badius TaxID=1455 RepID=UPI0007B34E52|nr:hypothetical protein [Bacillus badius]KZR57516.1 hypothetical protein A3781_19680 [Bacillus badius]
MKIKQATEQWVSSFNALPTSAVSIIRDYEEVNGDTFQLVAGKESLDTYNSLPAWGTMWTFNDRLDSDWFRENLQVLEDCGFTAYESEELGLIIGVNGAGYDFYESHWIPLYKARGLRWHDEG